jgi:hypothetical protein
MRVQREAASAVNVELAYTPSEWLLVDPDDAPIRGGFRARLKGAYAQGTGRTAHEALEHLETALREWVGDWDADSDEFGYPALDDAKDVVNRHSEPPLVGELRTHLREGCLLAVLESAAGEPVLVNQGC